jgi:putative flippase GtrA
MLKIVESLKRYPLINKFLQPETLGQFVRYFLVGIFCFSFEYLLFILLRDLFSLNELLVNIMVYTVIFWINFLLNRNYSFKSKNDMKRQLLLYTPLFFFNLVVGNVLLFSGIRSLLVLSFGENSWPVLYLPKILIMFFIVSWNFVLYKKVIYK